MPVRQTCCLSFLNCFSNINDYSMSVLQTLDFTNYQNTSRRIFPEQWDFLSSLQNVNEDRDGSTLTAFKERQVFVTILLLLHQSNFRSLPHWCLILLMTMYGWGAQKMLANVTSFIGTTVSWIYRDRFFTSLTSSVFETVTQLLSRQICGLMVLDNFQHGVQLRNQRGGHSSKFLIGTTEAAHHVIPILIFKWDHCKIEMTYTKDLS
jgi:hypothetical protein